ncbi:MAG: 50S ribosomal protein L30 [Candidatus Aenigmarchaeota archaeon]|nr:50S ribosomal protein L30 [Candidatus Aenigmarchaeota archaeon]
MFAVIRIRGKVNLKYEIKDTFKMLRLSRVNHCVLIRKDPSLEGMVRKVKDWVTWGEINDDTLRKMVTKRGRLPGDKEIPSKDVDSVISKIKKNEETGIKQVFRLSPPVKGHGLIKHPYPRGALGYRGDKINELIERMI